ncbi:bactofilin family protein [Minwuia sp.]|uniref:bactofilin family protein n=1 Tax=Minwuia sp. TaxID=2493630 RepID=UPI003A8FF707
MFRKKPTEEPEAAPVEGPVLPLKQGKQTAFRPEPATPGRAHRRDEGNKGMAPDAKTLVIGRQINLKGEIGDCETLMIHGSAEATLSNCKGFVITESGVLKGVAEVEQAEVMGRFEGTLKVRGRLIIRSGGRVQGSISYAEIEIEPGGRLDGTIDSIDPELVQARAAG